MRKSKATPTAVAFQSMKLGMGALPAAFVAAAVLSAGNVAAADARDVTHYFDIPAQKLNDALQALAFASQQKLLYSSKLVDGKGSPELKGEFTTEEAVKRLLAGTGLVFQITADGLVVIQDRNSSTSSLSSVERMHLAQASGATTSGASAAGAVRAESSEESSLEDSSAKDTIQEIIVTAQKRAEILQDVPISISVLSGELLDKSTFTGALEALKTVPGVALLPGTQTGGGGTMINIRGVGAAAAISNGSALVGYYLDAVPFSLIRDAITPDQNAFDLERVEVLRGPQGTLYGASSVNGLVRVLTKDPDLDEFELKARTTVSDTDGADDLNYRADAAVNVPLIEGKLAVRAVMGYDSAAGWIENLTEENVNKARTRNFRLKVGAQPTDALSIGVSAWINRGRKDGLPISNEDYRINTGLPEDVVEDFDAYNLELGYEFSAVSLMSSTSYMTYDAVGALDITFFNLPGNYVFSEFPSEAFSQEVILNSTPDSSWKWTAGVFYRDIKASLSQTSTTPLALPRPNAYNEQSRSAALFGQIGRRFGNEKWEWSLGARYFEDEIDHEQDVSAIAPGGTQYRVQESYDAVTPRAVLTWYPSRDVTIYGSYSQGFRSGLPLAFSVASSQPTFPDAEPDKLNNYEVGAKMDLMDGRLVLESAVYYIKWDDVQQTIGVPFNGVQVNAPINGESASGAGVDLAITARPMQGLELGLNAGWNDLTLDGDTFTGATGNVLLLAEGERLNASPELTSGVFFRHNRPLGGSGYRGELSVSANYVSEMITRQAATPRARVLTGDDLVFGKASIMVESPAGWTASLFVDNFTNEYGGALGAANAAGELRLSRPHLRTVGLQVDYRFD